MTAELAVLLDRREIGRLRRDARGRTSFAYDPAWQRTAGAFPLSLSMPLAQGEHEHRVVDAFLWGLLPDSEVVLDRWARRFHASARNAFALLSHVGEDCAGAVRLVTLERAAAIARGAEERARVEWLDAAAVAERLRELRADGSLWRRANDSGQFSLAGAQPKTALLLAGSRWGLPSGRTPTTHVLKPGNPGLDGHAENEHFCLSLAREVGLPAALSWIERFEDEVAVVIERYDRQRAGGRIVRVHQEDFCQALSVHPARKYESEGGPGARVIVELLRESSRAPAEDVATFVATLAYAWLIVGTDAHAKNYSLLIGAGGRIRLAPLYDLASALPYDELRLRKLKLAMRVGGKYRVHEIGPYQWKKLAAELALDPNEVRTRVRDVCLGVVPAAAEVLRRTEAAGLAHPILPRLAKDLAARAKRCADELR